jgi:hypothetical protein
MNTEKHLLSCLAEECAEVAQRALKSTRFGLDDVQQGQPFNNRERLIQEFNDLLGCIELLQERGHLPPSIIERIAIDTKKARVLHYMDYAAAKGELRNSRKE